MTVINMERRRSGDRRHQDSGPPPGQEERRRILARRALNLASHSVADWLAEPLAPQSARTPR